MELKQCLLCRKLTTGSVGRAGMVWPMICQGCKNLEDDALESRLKNDSHLINLVNTSLQ